MDPALRQSFINEMNRVDAKHRQAAQRRNAARAPRATGGYAQAVTGGTKKIKVKGSKPHTRTITRTGGAPAPATPPVNPDQSLIDAAIRLRYGPQEQALRNQLSQNAMYSQGLPQWYQQAADEIRRIQAGANAQAQNTIGQVQSYASQPTLPNGTDQQAATARNNLNAAFASQIGANATSNSGALDRFMAAMAIQQANQAGQAQLQRIGLYGQQGQLGQQKADYGLQYGSQLQSAEQKALADQQKIDIALKALGLKRDTLEQVQKPLAQSLQQDRKAGQKVARTNARTQRTNARTQQGNLKERRQQNRVQNAIDVNKLALDAYMKAHPELSGKSKGGKFTDTQVRNNERKFRTVQGMLKPDYVKQHPEVSIQRLVREKNIDPLLARAVVQTIAGGGVDRKTATAYYRAYGHHLRVKDLGEKTVSNVIKFFQGQ